MKKTEEGKKRNKAIYCIISRVWIETTLADVTGDKETQANARRTSRLKLRLQR